MLTSLAMTHELMGTRCWSHVQQVLHQPLCISQLQSSLLDRVLGLKDMSQAQLPT